MAFEMHFGLIHTLVLFCMDFYVSVLVISIWPPIFVHISYNNYRFCRSKNIFFVYTVCNYAYQYHCDKRDKYDDKSYKNKMEH